MGKSKVVWIQEYAKENQEKKYENENVLVVFILEKCNSYGIHVAS
jgi:hypothetical protein